MAPKRQAKAQSSSASQNQGEMPDPQSEAEFDNDDNEEPEGDDVAQLWEQIRTLTRDRKGDQKILGQILAQLTALSAAQAQTPPQGTVHSVERDTPLSTSTQERPLRYSKKQPDPQPLSNGIDPTFESWKLQIQGKFRVNADHFEDEEAKMFYLFNCTTRDA